MATVSSGAADREAGRETEEAPGGTGEWGTPEWRDLKSRLGEEEEETGAYWPGRRDQGGGRLEGLGGVTKD
ncbi:hypothetical protein NDU88_002921 [Pleurodeles waltl]|uniref:Uncharacterized protein n=1 Tax=Pleurodeles waltl TaxID=8319 RepID=A0AAV7MYR3_PLEWA|nr:hypothetical protein NDU88_002921 [Pleurodeles waltl]